ncbi:MAG: alpha/beta hydrolase [Spirochaetes bacterium]|nr:alpha/beta hydrolase [Spirochaetota bacterium]
MDTLVAGGVSIAYEVAGEGPRGETVALLNGIAMSMGHWKPVAAALAASGFRVLLHDMRGQLLSDKPAGPYSFEEHARDLLALLDATGTELVHLVGTSYGAEAALCFARDFPGRTASLCMIDGVCELDAVLVAAVDSWKRAALSDPSLFYRVILPWNYSPEWLAANSGFVASREAAVASLPREYFEAFVRLCDAFLAIDLRKDIARIRTPTLVAVAEFDILKGERFAKVMAEGIAGAHYRKIVGAGHAVVIEKPGEVSRLILEFLGSIGSTKGPGQEEAS